LNNDASLKQNNSARVGFDAFLLYVAGHKTILRITAKPHILTYGVVIPKKTPTQLLRKSEAEVGSRRVRLLKFG
jgi:hypothetical protein